VRAQHEHRHKIRPLCVRERQEAVNHNPGTGNQQRHSSATWSCRIDSTTSTPPSMISPISLDGGRSTTVVCIPQVRLIYNEASAHITILLPSTSIVHLFLEDIQNGIGRIATPGSCRLFVPVSAGHSIPYRMHPSSESS
jgi:hypothetical protein